MSAADRLITILVLWNSLAVEKKSIPRTLVQELAAIICLSVMAVIMTAALVLGGLFMLGHLLMNHGMETRDSITVAAVVAVMILACVLYALHNKIEKFRAMPYIHDLGSSRRSVTAYAQEIAGAFVDGLLRRPPRPLSDTSN